MTPHLLWVDDEIELLRAHILFLEKKGYQMSTASNGADALDLCQRQAFDLILLDEMMPGLSGLETLERIKRIQPATPVVMVTKSEEENIMDQAIGRQIADYLIKPVNPSQILLSLKKNIHRQEIQSEVTDSNYRQEFARLSADIDCCRTAAQWQDIHRRLAEWDIELERTDSPMRETLQSQKEEANAAFAKYVRKNYVSWVQALPPAQGKGPADRPVMSPEVMKNFVFPLVDSGRHVFFILIDNFRYDQWLTIAADLAADYEIESSMYCSILPTATQYGRNALFSGLMPLQIAKMYPDLWVDEDEDEGKNLREEELLRTLVARYRRHDRLSYVKAIGSDGVDGYLRRIPNLAGNDINVIVLNFIDMLAHARTDSLMARELANNEAAYRSITLSWFRHSAIAEIFKALAKYDITVVITTDHGSIRATRPVKIVGDRNTNTNLRYKLGKNLNHSAPSVFDIERPSDARLPSPNLTTSYAFATGDTFFAYPNNYNYYSSYYKDTFQHGGISLEEMLVPLATLTPKRRG